MVGVRDKCRPPSRGASFLVTAAADMHDVLRRLEVFGLAIVPVGELEIALEDELRVVELVHDNRSVCLCQSQCRLAALIDEPMGNIQWNAEQVPFAPPKALRFPARRRHFSRARASENVNLVAGDPTGGR